MDTVNQSVRVLRDVINQIKALSDDPVKEKKLIIDEIDVELQVLEREIQRAEQSGSTKKYRQLLTIQKNIQRRRQEIYYSLAKKGRRIPMQSTQGLRGRE